MLRIPLVALVFVVLLTPTIGTEAGKPANGPDLVVDHLVFVDIYGSETYDYPTITSGQPFLVDAIVRNAGNRDAGGNLARLTIGDYQVSGATKTLIPNEECRVLFTITQEMYMSMSGSVVVQADYLETVTETNEGNNLLTRSVNIVPADWTLAVYISGDAPSMFLRDLQGENFVHADLKECAIDNFMALARQDSLLGGSSPKVSVVVMMDLGAGDVNDCPEFYSNYYDGWTDTKLFFVTPDLQAWSWNALDDDEWPTTLIPGEQNLGDPYVLSEFGKWAFSRFESTGTCLMLQGYGGGSLGMLRDVAQNTDPWTSSYDDLTPNELLTSVQSISQSIGGKIGLLGIDAAYGSQIEVNSDLSPFVDYMVCHQNAAIEMGSALLPNDNPPFTYHNWYYQDIVHKLKHSPGEYDLDFNLDGMWQPDEVALAVFLGYKYYYEYGMAQGCNAEKDVAMYNLAFVSQNIVPRLNSLADILILKILLDPTYWRDVIQKARQRDDALAGVQDSYWYLNNPGDTEMMHRFCDIVNFCSALEYETDDSAVEQACENLRNSWKDANGLVQVWTWNDLLLPPLPGLYGLSIYWPETNTATDHLSDAQIEELTEYTELTFCQNSRWDDFLRAYHGISNTPVPGEPELYIKFDEGSGRNAYDSSGNGYTGTLYDENGGQAAFDINGKFGGCLDLWNQPLEYPTPPNPPGTGSPGAYAAWWDTQTCNFGLDLTITVWIKPTTVERPFQWIVAKQVSTAYDRVYSMLLTGSHPTFCIGSQSAGSFITWINGPSITPATWHFIAIRRDASTGVAEMRVDDTWYSATIALPGPAYTAGRHWLGVGDTGDRFYGGGGRGFEGSIDDLRIFDEAATYDEIMAIHNNYQPPSVPTGLVAIPGDGQVVLSWDASTPNGGKELLGYNIYRSQSPGPEISIQSVGPNTLTYTDTGLSNGQTYYYVVKARNEIGESLQSNEVSATPVDIRPPGACQNLAAEPGNTQVVLGWTPPSDDGGSHILGYTMYRSTSLDPEFPIRTVGVDVLTFTDTGLTNGLTYYYVVRAYNSIGEGLPSNEVSAIPVPPGPPGTVPNLKATPIPGGIVLTWSEPPNGGSPIEKYIIYRGTRSGQETYYSESHWTNLEFGDVVVSPGKTYYYKVTAVNAFGESLFSECTEVSAKVPR
jgi:hypothetical protein